MGGRYQATQSLLDNGLVIVGVGEVGHYLLRAITEQGYIFPWYLLIDPDKVEAKNPSFEGKNVGVLKVMAVANWLRKQRMLKEYQVRLISSLQDIRAAISPNAIIVAPFKVSPEAKLPGLVFETTDDSTMWRMPHCYHVHTGLINEERAFFQVSSVPRTLPTIPHYPEGCTGLLSEAAKRAGEWVARNFEKFTGREDVEHFEEVG